MTNYSNPRIEAIIENWPMGFTRKVTAKFFIEVNNKGERAVRETEAYLCQENANC
jgi:hypothetical protein